MIDQDYVKSMDAWFKGLEHSIEQTKNTIAFNKAEIELHQKHIEVNLLQLTHDENRLERAKKEFAEYIELNK